VYKLTGREGAPLSGNQAQLYTKYPLSSVFIYNGATLAHYLLGAAGIVLGYNSLAGNLGGVIYLAFSLFEMYLHMPLKVCPNCAYFKLDSSLCISGLNLFSRKVAVEGDVKEFSGRAKGLLCPNNLYIASLIIPVIAIIPALIVNFSLPVLAIFLAVVALLVFRFFVIFLKIACVHCRAKDICPQARSMFKDLKAAELNG
jgi:hypothetical protein